MKKISAFLFCLVCLFVSQEQASFLEFVDPPKSATVYFYTSGQAVGEEKIKTGNGYIIISSLRNSENVLSENRNIIGQSLSFEGNTEIYLEYKNRLNLVVVKEESVLEIKTLYGYTPKIKNFILIDGQKVNIQMALNKNIISVGTPIILGSY